MGLVDAMNRAADRLNDYAADQRDRRTYGIPGPVRGAPRVLHEDDVQRFIDAANARPPRQMAPPPAPQQFDDWLAHRYPMRYRRLMNDLNWYRRKLEKFERRARRNVPPSGGL